MPKFKNIKAKKEKLDQAKNNLFVKLAREIYMEAKKGGPNPEANFKLKNAIANARAVNMPNENIERAIKKAAGGQDHVNYEEVIYEGYGPGGAAIMVRALTDNRNRTAAEIRAIFNKRGGNMGETGCVSYMFEEKGILTIDRNESDMDEEAVLLAALEAGAEDLKTWEDHYEIVTAPRDFEAVKNALEEKGLPIVNGEIRWIPQTMITIPEEHREKLMKMIEAFEENDDVQDVYVNFELD